MSSVSRPVAAHLPWVQGMREAEPDKTHELTWQEVFFRRLEGRWGSIPTGPETASAETKLGFRKSMSYFYVGRCVPAFGAHAVASIPAVCESKTTPFDTGALVSRHGYIVTSPPVELREAAEFVEQWSYTGDRYHAPMTTWLEQAYPSAHEYVRGVRPRMHVVNRIALEQCRATTDGRVWTWEVRVPLEDYESPPTTAVKVYFAEGTRECYSDWIYETDMLDTNEKERHLDRLYSVSEEVADVADAMNAFLVGRLP